VLPCSPLAKVQDLGKSRDEAKSDAKVTRRERDRIARDLAAARADLEATVGKTEALERTAYMLSKADVERAENSARLEELQKQLETWRNFGMQQHARVQYLESELAKQFAAAKAQSEAEGGRLLFAAIASFGLGTAVSRPSSKGTRRSSRRIVPDEVASVRPPSAGARDP
jgi:hypothetical protein